MTACTHSRTPGHSSCHAAHLVKPSLGYWAVAERWRHHNEKQMEAGVHSFWVMRVFSRLLCSQVRPWRQGGALPGQGEAVEPGLRRSEGWGERSLPVSRRVPAAPGLPAHVVAALLQTRAAVASAGVRGRPFRQWLHWGERGGKLRLSLRHLTHL